MSEKYLSELAAKLWSLYKKERKYSVFRGVLYTLTLWTGLLFLGFLFSLILVTTGWAKVFFMAGLGGTTFLITRFLVLPNVKKPSLTALAKKAETGFPELEDRLISALELTPYLQNPRGFSPQLIEAVIVEAHQKSTGKDFSRLADRRPVVKAARITAFAILITALLPFLSWPVFKLTVTALGKPFSAIEEVLPYKLFTWPEGGKAVKMKDFEVKVTAVGKNLPKKGNLYYRFEGGSWHPVALSLAKKKETFNPAAPETSLAGYVFKELRRNIDFYFASNRTRTKTYHLEVVDVPYIKNLKIGLKPPAYTGLSIRQLTDNDGNIASLTGSKVSISFICQKPLKSGRLTFNDGKTIPVKIKNNTGDAAFTLAQAGSYHIEVIDQDGNPNVDPIEYELRPIPDEMPQVEITRPGADLDLTERMFETLGIEAKDDFGFSSLKLQFTITSERAPERKKSINLPLSGPDQASLLLAYGWDLSTLRLNPGDVVSYYVEAADNDAVSGPKKAQSKTYRFRLPGLDEMIAEAARGTEENLDVLEEAAAEQMKLLQKFQQKAKELLQSGKLDWENQKQLQELGQKQEELQNRLDQMQQSFQQNLEKMQDNDLLNQQLNEKMQELARLWEKVATPEMKEQMKKLKEALDKLDPELLQKALEEFNFTQEELLKNLQRSIDLLKRMAQEQKMDALLKQAEKALKDQKEINKDAKEGKRSSSDLAQKEKKVKEGLEQLEKKAAELKKEMAEKPFADSATANQFCNSPSKSDAKKKASETEQNFEQGKMKQGQQSGAETEEELEKMLNQMRQAKNNMDRSEEEKNLAEMNKNLQDILTLSEKQEELSKQLQELPQMESPNLNQMAQEQNELSEETNKLCQRLDKLGRQTLYFQTERNSPTAQCQNSMSQAVRNLNNRNPLGALQNQKEAMYQLNKAAKQMVQSMQNCKSGQCSSGAPKPGQKMQGMCKKQGGINAQTEEIGQNGLKPEELAAYGRLKAQERDIQRELEEMKRQYQENKNVLGRTDELSKDLAKLVEEMERGPSETVLRHQAQILNRMLDFQNSLQKQGEDQRRKAEKAVDIFHLSPKDLSPDLGRRAAEMEELLKKFMDEPRPPEYEEAIRSYFETLKIQNLASPPQK